MIDFEKNTISLDYFQSIIREIKNNNDIYLDIVDSFSPNQFKSKCRLFENIENLNILDSSSTVVLFGSWYGSILVPYLAPKVKWITTIDLDDRAVRISKNKFFKDYSNIDCITADVFKTPFNRYHNECNLFINTSCEHMPPMNEWPHWNKIKTGAYFAFQSNNMSYIEDHTNCVNSVNEFKAQMPLNSKILLTDELADDRGIRFTIIGQIL